MRVQYLEQKHNGLNIRIMSNRGTHRLANYFRSVNLALERVDAYHLQRVGCGVREYSPFSGDFGNWGFELLDNISAMETASLNLLCAVGLVILTPE